MPETSSAHTIDIPGLPGASAGLTGEFAVPEGTGPWPGVVLVHEAFGINDVMRRQAERFARAGYIAIMPDLFTEGGARKCLTQTFRELTAGTGRSFADIESARQLLMARVDCTGQVGVIGFCMGGGFALAAATVRPRSTTAGCPRSWMPPSTGPARSLRVTAARTARSGARPPGSSNPSPGSGSFTT
jgi:carboxymethylenebutenolidase